MKRFLHISIFLLSFILCFSLCGCGDEQGSQLPPSTNGDTTSSTAECSETINNIEWTIRYNIETKEIVSIYAFYTEIDRTSDYYKFVAYYHGDNNMYVNHSVSLMGAPIGDDWYQIEQVEEYIMPFADNEDWERVKNTYPTCTFDAAKKSITLSTRTTRYEEKFLFTNPRS